MSSTPTIPIRPAAPAPEAPSAVMPLVYGRRELALALGISLATLDRLDAAGKLPAAVRIGNRKVWPRAVIADWLQVSCPDRRTWEAIQAAQHTGRPQ